MAMPPSSVAVLLEIEPKNEPMGVLTAELETSYDQYVFLTYKNSHE